MNKIALSIVLIIGLFALIYLSFTSYQKDNSNLEVSEEKSFKKEITQKLDPRKNYEIREIKIGDKNYQIFVASTQDKKTLGLSVFEDIEDNEGMLFEFQKEDFHSFWMKDMKFNIDIIFLDKNKKIIEIFENVSKDSYQSETNYQKFVPNLRSKFVLELKAGEASARGLKRGNTLNF